MGVDVEFVPTAWDGIIPQLVAGNFDVIISGMSIAPARNLTVNFTQPYAYSGLTILANKEMTDGFTLEDYNSPEVTFAARPPPPLHSCSQRRHCCCLTKTVPRPKKC